MLQFSDEITKRQQYYHVKIIKNGSNSQQKKYVAQDGVMEKNAYCTLIETSKKN
jgi:hypothetical protein